MKISKSVTIEGVTYTLGALNLDQYEAHFIGEDGEPLKRPRTAGAIRDSLANGGADNPLFEDIPAGHAAKLIWSVLDVSGFERPAAGEARAEATA